MEETARSVRESTKDLIFIGDGTAHPSSQPPLLPIRVSPHGTSRAYVTWFRTQRLARREKTLDAHIVRMVDHIRKLESELEVEFAKRRLQLAYSVNDRVIHFEERVLKRHRELKRGLWNYVSSARPMVLITAPIIYSLIIPFVLLDAFISIYQYACFPVYGIATVSRRKYWILDRGQLAYLNLIEKLNCTFCSYVNGLIGYVREIASITEQYWCPIKHARRVIGTHERYGKFADYGDAESYHGELRAFRAALHTDSEAAP